MRRTNKVKHGRSTLADIALKGKMELKQSSKN
jgi:hypothetical protein